MKHRIAVITGASSGIGRATALRLAEEGYRLVLNARNKEKLCKVGEEAARISGIEMVKVEAGDATDPQVTERCIAISLDAWKELPGVLIACAGRGLPGTVLNSDPSQWDDLINTNIKGLMYQMKGFGKIMLDQADGQRDFVEDPLDIVVVGSTIGRNVSPFNSVYGSTKFAAHGLTEALRRQLGPRGIRVTLVEPGLVGTNFQQAAGYDPDWFKNYSTEVGPILTGNDVAGVIAFLLGLPGNVHLDNISIRPTRQAYP